MLFLVAGTVVAKGPEIRNASFSMQERMFHSPDGTVDPLPGAPRLPSYGVNLLQLACNPLMLGEVGHAVFQFELSDSADKVWYKYGGVNLLPTTEGEKTIKHEYSSSFLELSKKTKFSLSSKIGVEMMGKGGGGAGVGFQKDKESKVTSASNITWELQTLSQIDNTFIILGGKEHPPLAPHFQSLIDTECTDPLKEMRHSNLSSAQR